MSITDLIARRYEMILKEYYYKKDHDKNRKININFQSAIGIIMILFAICSGIADLFHNSFLYYIFISIPILSYVVFAIVIYRDENKFSYDKLNECKEKAGLLKDLLDNEFGIHNKVKTEEVLQITREDIKQKTDTENVKRSCQGFFIVIVCPIILSLIQYNFDKMGNEGLVGLMVMIITFFGIYLIIYGTINSFFNKKNKLREIINVLNDIKILYY